MKKKSRVATLKRESLSLDSSQTRFRPSSPGASSEIPDSITIDSTISVSDGEIEISGKDDLKLPPLVNDIFKKIFKNMKYF